MISGTSDDGMVTLRIEHLTDDPDGKISAWLKECANQTKVEMDSQMISLMTTGFCVGSHKFGSSGMRGYPGRASQIKYGREEL